MRDFVSFKCVHVLHVVPGNYMFAHKASRHNGVLPNVYKVLLNAVGRSSKVYQKLGSV